MDIPHFRSIGGTLQAWICWCSLGENYLSAVIYECLDVEQNINCKHWIAFMFSAGSKYVINKNWIDHGDHSRDYIWKMNFALMMRSFDLVCTIMLLW